MAVVSQPCSVKHPANEAVATRLDFFKLIMVTGLDSNFFFLFAQRTFQTFRLLAQEEFCDFKHAIWVMVVMEQ